MNAISPRRERDLLSKAARPPLRIEMADWLPSVAACQRRLADRPELGPQGRASSIARATENELAAHALLRGDGVESIRVRLRALRGDTTDGGQLFGILEIIEEKESAR